MKTSKDTILLLGLGNTLLTDEAVGVRVVEHLQTAPQAQNLGLKFMDGGTMGLTLLVDMEDADALIVVDAAILHEPFGTVRAFEGEDMDHFLRHRGRSPHDIGLDDIMDGLRLRGAVPERRAMIAIQPAVLTIGERLSPAVQKSVAVASRAVLELVQRWQTAK